MRLLNNIAIAIDGGGTQCRLALVSTEGYESVLSGSANASSDFSGTVRSVLTGVNSLAQQVSLPTEELIKLPAYIGVAGVLNESIANQLKQSLPFRQVRIEDDRPSALCGALGGRDGFIAHCGTGSFFAVQRNGQQRFAGGWGPILDDVAGAYWVARNALAATLYAHDELVEQSTMTQTLLAEFGSAASVVAYAAETSPADLAQLAKRVTVYAENKDAHAQEILQRGALILKLKLTQLGWSEGDSVCLTGGLAAHYRFYLPDELQREVVKAKGEPIDGAVILARRFVRELNA